MAYDPIEIWIGDSDGSGWSKSTGWTSMSLERSKDNLTGSLRVEYFFGYQPEEVVHVDAAYGREILVYVNGWLSFTGIIDRRNGSGHSSTDIDNGRSSSIGSDEYVVTINARGKTKQLIDSSHDIVANMNGSTVRNVINRLISPWNIDLVWSSSDNILDKARLRDGSRVVDEINRLALENGHYIFEGRDGSLIVSDGTPRGSGDDIILGKNILRFSANQAEARAKSRIRVKGQRTDDGMWGEDAILPTVLDVESNDLLSDALRPIIVQHYGDASPELLKRRAYYEANKRAQLSKNVTVDLFSVENKSGQPWDLGISHRVVIPPEGIDDILECTSLRVSCSSGGEINTTLTLSPLPQVISETETGPLSSLPEEDFTQTARNSNIIYDGNYPAPWSIGQFTVSEVPVLGDFIEFISDVTNSIFNPSVNIDDDGSGKPPERLS